MIAILIGTILWIVIGPVIAISGVTIPEGFRAYPWLSNPDPRAVVEVTPTYWACVLISWTGLFIFAAGVIGIFLSFILEYLGKDKKRQDMARQR